MPRPVLTRSRIVAAGLAVVTELGLASLNLRSVARRVHATTTGVQRHMSPTELTEAVVGEIMTTMPALPVRGEWTSRLRLWAVRTRTWLAEYPGLAHHLLLNRWNVPTAIDRVEELVELLGSVGLDAADSVTVGSTLYWFVLSRADLDESDPVIGAEWSKQRIAASPDRWPNLAAEVAGQAVDAGAAAQAQFGFGLDLLLRGIGQRANGGPPLTVRSGGLLRS